MVELLGGTSAALVCESGGKVKLNLSYTGSARGDLELRFANDQGVEVGKASSSEYIQTGEKKQVSFTIWGSDFPGGLASCTQSVKAVVKVR